MAPIVMDPAVLAGAATQYESAKTAADAAISALSTNLT